MTIHLKRAFLFLLILLGSASHVLAGEASIYGFELIQAYPHDPAAFTQGLVYEAGSLYEGTGLNGRSSLRKIELKSGRILKIHSLPPEHFGEGITIFGERIIQLTWRSGRGFIYEKGSFRKIGEFRYKSEGWGLTHDGRDLIMSDGSAVLRFLDPKKFKVVRKLKVTSGGRPIDSLNELEYVKGEIYANIWGQDLIARISPKTGQVLGWIDLTGLRNRLGTNHQAEVLNGIAYVPERDTLLVTGKNWPLLFEIRIFKKLAPRI